MLRSAPAKQQTRWSQSSRRLFTVPSSERSRLRMRSPSPSGRKAAQALSCSATVAPSAASVLAMPVHTRSQPCSNAR